VTNPFQTLTYEGGDAPTRAYSVGNGLVTRSRTLYELIRALEAAGCAPRQVDARTWLAICPSCRGATAEIRAVVGEPPIISCIEACERRVAA
jgi:hypothetical protein